MKKGKKRGEKEQKYTGRLEQKEQRHAIQIEDRGGAQLFYCDADRAMVELK